MSRRTRIVEVTPSDDEGVHLAEILEHVTRRRQYTVMQNQSQDSMFTLASVAVALAALAMFVSRRL